MFLYSSSRGKLNFDNKSTVLRIKEAEMPKMKTNCSAKKRFKKTASGQYKREKAFKSHILTKKNRKRKRNLRTSTIVDKTNKKYVRDLLAGG